MKTIATAVAFLKGLSWQVYAGAAALLLLGSIVWYCDNQVDKRVEQAEVTGATDERATGLGETIKNVETANEAAQEINAPGPNCVKYSQCLRTNRGEDKVCERFLRGGSKDQCSNQ